MSLCLSHLSWVGFCELMWYSEFFYFGTDYKLIIIKDKLAITAIKRINSKRKWICVKVYNDGNTETMISQLTPTLEKLTKDDFQIILAGEFNINMMEENRRKQDWVNFMKTYDIIQTIYGTRITSKTSTCIDGINVKVDYHLVAQVIQTHISDHCVQKICFTIKNTQNFTYRRILSLSSQNWSSIYESDNENVDEQFNKFHDIFLENFNKNCPSIKFSINIKHKTYKSNNPLIQQVKKKLDILLILSQKDERF